MPDKSRMYHRVLLQKHLQVWLFLRDEIEFFETTVDYWFGVQT